MNVGSYYKEQIDENQIVFEEFKQCNLIINDSCQDLQLNSEIETCPFKNYGLGSFLQKSVMEKLDEVFNKIEENFKNPGLYKGCGWNANLKFKIFVEEDLTFYVMIIKQISPLSEEIFIEHFLDIKEISKKSDDMQLDYLIKEKITSKPWFFIHILLISIEN